MENSSAKAIHRRDHRPAGETRRKNVLILAAILLALAFPPVFHNVPNKAPIVAAFLLPALQISWALYEFDQIRSSQLVVRQSITLDCLSYLFSIAMFLLAAAGEPSLQVWLLISCVFVISGFLFQRGLGLATKLRFPNFYSVLAVNFAIGRAKASGTEMSPAVCAMASAPLLLNVVLVLIDGFGKKMFLAEVMVE